MTTTVPRNCSELGDLFSPGPICVAPEADAMAPSPSATLFSLLDVASGPMATDLEFHWPFTFALAPMTVLLGLVSRLNSRPTSA